MYKHSTHIATLGKVARPGRRIQPLGSWARLFDFSKVKNIREDYKANGNTYDTLNLMAKYAKEQAPDMKALTDSLAATSLKATLHNYWQWVYNHVAYVDDKVWNPKKQQWEDGELVRKPLNTIKEQKGDCDCMTTLLSAMMLSQGIKHALRKAKYIQEDGTQGDWQHVYAVVPLNQQNPDYSHVIVLDCVLDTFNEEHNYSKTYDKEMKIQGLGNLPIQGLGNTPAQPLPVITTVSDVQSVVSQIHELAKGIPEMAKFESPMKYLLMNFGTASQRIRVSRELTQLSSHPFYVALHNLIVAIDNRKTQNLPQLSEKVVLYSPVAEIIASRKNGVSGLASIFDNINISEEQGSQALSILYNLTGGNNNTPPQTNTSQTPQTYYQPQNPYAPTNNNAGSGNNTALYVVGGVLALGLVGTAIYLIMRDPAPKK